MARLMPHLVNVIRVHEGSRDGTGWVFRTLSNSKKFPKVFSTLSMYKSMLAWRGVGISAHLVHAKS